MAIGRSTKRLLSSTVYMRPDQDAALDELKKVVGLARSVVIRDGIDMAIVKMREKFQRELEDYREKMKEGIDE